MNTPQEFAALIAALRVLPSGGDAAMVTLTRTFGPTFRRAGARMLVHADGRIVRGLSAGCPEQDIAARAREAIADGRARVLRYDREHGQDLLLEMGCGGELEVLVEPLRDRDDWRYAEQIDAVLRERGRGVLATLFRQDGADLARPRRWLFAGSERLDEIGDPSITQPLRKHVQYERSQVLAIGNAELFVEPVLPPLAALLFGVNASARALARLLEQLGWAVTLVDHQEIAPEATHRRLRYDARTFAVVMTHNLERDLAYLRALRGASLAYLGAVGARRRAARLFEATGLDATQLHAPAGLDLGSETPEEIALSIAAELLAVANGASGGRLSAMDTPIHR